MAAVPWPPSGNGAISAERSRTLIIIAGVMEVSLLVAALIDIARRPASRGGAEADVVPLAFVNVIGPVSYFLVGPRSHPASRAVGRRGVSGGDSQVKAPRREVSQALGEAYRAQPDFTSVKAYSLPSGAAAGRPQPLRLPRNLRFPRKSGGRTSVQSAEVAARRPGAVHSSWR